jgi:hypothetical protein
LEALNTSKKSYDTLIEILTPIVAAEPNYADGNAKQLLYTAYLDRGDARREASEIVGALSDYEAALALKVDDPSEVQTHRAELLLAFARQAVQPTPQPDKTVESSGSGGETESSAPTPEPVRIRFGRPKLIAPEDDIVFVGRLFQEAFVEWQPVGELAEDEYYDLTIMHIFADQPKYWGLAVKETRLQLTEDIGVGQAGGDRFYWWVTVRKANTASSATGIDLPVSLQSEVRTFVWIP